MRAGERPDGAVALELEKRGLHAGHVGPRVEGHMAELLEADLEDRLAGFHKALVVGHVTGREAGHVAAASPQ